MEVPAFLSPFVEGDTPKRLFQGLAVGVIGADGSWGHCREKVGNCEPYVHGRGFGTHLRRQV